MSASKAKLFFSILVSAFIVASCASADILFTLDSASTGTGNFGVQNIPGLQSGDTLTTFSFGDDSLGNALNFTVDREALGASGSAVNFLSNPSGAGGANGNLFYSATASGTNTVALPGSALGIASGYLGDNITGFESVVPTPGSSIYFVLGPGSPTLATNGWRSDDILVSGPNGLHLFAAGASLGLNNTSDILTGLTLSIQGQTDSVLFSISAFSPDASTSGGSLDPGNAYLSTLTGSNQIYRSASDLGLLAQDQLEDIKPAVSSVATTPEPSTFLLIGAALLLCLALRWKRVLVFHRIVGLALIFSTLVIGAETCSSMAGASPDTPNSSGTLILPDLSAKAFRWISKDSTFGSIDTGVLSSNTWTTLAGPSPRIIFTGTYNGITLQASVLLGTRDQEGTVDLFTSDAHIEYIIRPSVVQVSRIKFDYTGPDTNTSDGLNIRYDATHDLAHIGNGIGLGEWIEGTRNEPAAWVANQSVSIQVRFTTSNPFLQTADLSASAKAGLLPDVSAAHINFANGVSSPEYVTLTLARPTDKVLNKVAETWLWNMANDNGCGTPSRQTDTSGPHTVYTLLSVPTNPWYAIDPGGLPVANTEPWVSALDFLTDTISLGTTRVGVNAKGAQSITQTASQTTTYLFANYGLSYDNQQGATRYVYSPIDNLIFDLTDFLARVSSTVNCYDLAAAVTSLTNLVGAQAEYHFALPFGYLKTALLIGWGAMNNPFFGETTSTYSQPISPPATCSDDLVKQYPEAPQFPPNAPVPNFYYRTSFYNHAFALIAGNVYDATVGPALGTLNETDYFAYRLDPDPFNVALRAGLYPGAGLCSGRNGVAGSADVYPAALITLE